MSAAAAQRSTSSRSTLVELGGSVVQVGLEGGRQERRWILRLPRSLEYNDHSIITLLVSRSHSYSVIRVTHQKLPSWTSPVFPSLPWPCCWRSRPSSSQRRGRPAQEERTGCRPKHAWGDQDRVETELSGEHNVNHGRTGPATTIYRKRSANRGEPK